MDDRDWLDSRLALSSVVYRLWSLSHFDLTLIDAGRSDIYNCYALA
jgi:hypothetical protein